jgi:hypothetical protein
MHREDEDMGLDRIVLPRSRSGSRGEEP